jgi:Holliday junction DNA helicase RuvA
VIDAGGVGLRVLIPLSSYDPSLKTDDRTRLLTHLHVREDAMTLYGFATEGERELFEILISVSGIGPPMARQILSGVSVTELRRLISTGDAKGLTRIKGIGPKLAQRLLLELKDRVPATGPEDSGGAEGSASGPVEEAVAALTALGAEPGRARKTVSDVLKGAGDELPVEELIRQALRRL